MQIFVPLARWVFTVLLSGGHEGENTSDDIVGKRERGGILCVVGAVVVFGNPGFVIFENYRTRRNGRMLPFTFQSIALSTQVNFQNVVLSGLAMSGSYFDICPRTPLDVPISHSTDTEDPLCV